MTARKETTPKPAPKPRKTKARDARLPKVGMTLTRTFKGKTYEVVVEHDGFRHDGKHWKSLTAVAKDVTGYPSISGTLFWGITKPRDEEKPTPPTPAKAPEKRKAGRPIAPRRGK